MGKTTKPSPLFWIGSLALLAACFLFSLFMGRFMVAPARVLEALGKLITHRELDGIQQSVVVGIRLPRTLMAMLVGAGLSVSGAAFQGLFQNPLVSPDVLGVSSLLGAVFMTLVDVASRTLLAASLEKRLLESRPGRKIRKLLYCPLKEDRLFYGRFPECVVCTGEPELEAALDGCQVLLADPCFAPWLAVHCPDCRLVPLPYPALGIYAF